MHAITYTDKQNIKIKQRGIESRFHSSHISILTLTERIRSNLNKRTSTKRNTQHFFCNVKTQRRSKIALRLYRHSLKFSLTDLYQICLYCLLVEMVINFVSSYLKSSDLKINIKQHPAQRCPCQYIEIN